MAFGAATFGYAAALLMGLTLGVMGSGGAIITVPILVYLFAIPTIDATTHSLLIVGVTSLLGVFHYWRRGEIDAKLLLRFTPAAVVGAFLARGWLIPALPEKLFQGRPWAMDNHSFVLLTFALVMLGSAGSMIWSAKPKKSPASTMEPKDSVWLLPLLGLLVGSISGFVGVGGGFLIIPVLYHLAKLPVKRAAGTSLTVISVQSFSGFLASLTHPAPLQWRLVVIIVVLAGIGMQVGNRISMKLPGEKLRAMFGWFVLSVALLIFVLEFQRRWGF